MEKQEIHKIIIVNSIDGSGGNIVLSVLCSLLAKRGYDARLFVHPSLFPSPESSSYLFWRDWVRFHLYRWMKKRINSFLKFFGSRYKLETWDFPYRIGEECKQELNPFFSRKRTIVVYPEVVYGNFLCAKNVVRWLLYHYKYSNDLEAYGKDDIFICYRKVFNDWKLNPKALETNLNYFDGSHIFQYNFGDRKSHCYLLRKGEKRPDLPNTFDGPVIHWSTSEADIVKLFNEYQFCYFYDTQTFFTVYAIICGCIPVVVPECGKKRSDYLKGDEMGYGVAYGDLQEEIEFATRTRNKVLEQLDNIDKNNEMEIDKFISALHDKFEIKKRFH